MAVFAIIGAGMAGVTLARELTEAGHRCQLFEKSRGMGGRLATRRFDRWQADHGAQYFTARSAAFQQQVDDWVQAGLVAEWPIRVQVLDANGLAASTPQTRYVGIPTMKAMLKERVQSLDVRLDTRIMQLEQSGDQWLLQDQQAQQYGPFDAVLMTLPPAQSQALVPASHPWQSHFSAMNMRPVWAQALVFDSPLAIDCQACFVNQGPFSWLARDSSKPGRPKELEVWMLHFSSQWSAAHLEATQPELQQQSLRVLADLATSPLPEMVAGFSHRWLYAQCPELSDSMMTSPLWDADLKLGIAGDWTLSGRVEGAWQSAQQLAQQLKSVF